MPLYQAREVAKEHNLDLVEVAPLAVPPVCRLLDYGRFKYEQAKKERESRKSQKAVILREVRLGSKIDNHDLDAKIRLVRRLLDGGDKVKVSVRFRGREAAHPEIGWDLLRRISASLEGIATVEVAPLKEGRNLSMILSTATTKHAKESEIAKA
jgi:translation initiation factor IF-3